MKHLTIPSTTIIAVVMASTGLALDCQNLLEMGEIQGAMDTPPAPAPIIPHDL
jgi:hypothetical protein